MLGDRGFKRPRAKSRHRLGERWLPGRFQRQLIRGQVADPVAGGGVKQGRADELGERVLAGQSA